MKPASGARRSSPSGGSVAEGDDGGHAPLTDAELDQLTGEVFATPAGRRWLEAMDSRADAPSTFVLAEIRARLRRMRQRWSGGPVTLA